MYEHGQGVNQDYKEAWFWYLTAAMQGHASAQFNLGVMYDNGQGVSQDYKEAVNWYRKAAEQGNSGAQNNLGVMYKHGQGVPQSLIIAYSFYNLSASIDFSDKNKAKSNRDKLVESMTAKEINEAQELSRNMAKPGNFLKALDLFVKNKIPKDKPNKAAKIKQEPINKSEASDGYPARPAKRPGVVSCNTSCQNSDCRRTYDTGRKVRFQAKQVFDPFSGEWKWDSGSC
jgi:hypothetical protein